MEHEQTDEHEPADSLETRLLAIVQAPDYRPVKARILAKNLGISSDDRSALRQLIHRLARRGLVSWGENHVVHAGSAAPGSSPAASRPVRSTLTGVYRRARAGYGFVRPSNQKPPADRSQDIYIPAGKELDAADGDLVAVRLQRGRRGPGGRTAGQIVEIIERETHRFVGVYLEREGLGYVQVDGQLFAQPILVGDPGAKSVDEGDKVVIEMVRFPSPVHDGEAVVVEVLGARGEPGVDTLSIIREFDLPEEFPEKVLDEARQQAERFDEALGTGRRDFRQLTTVTIDPIDARDFDDAISLERLENGHWRLGVHIADVTHFVPPGGMLDQEARERATSIYLPDRVIPMLPEIISNNLASLQPGRVRYTKSAFLEFTAEGARVTTEIHNGAIKSSRRFTYEEVDSFLEDPDAWTSKLSGDVFSLVSRMHELAMILRQRRLRRGAIELTLPEVKIDLDKKGRVKGAHLVENTVSHQIIEEFMLAANEAVAEYLTQHELAFLRRIHEPPDPRRLDSLTHFVRDLGLDCDSMESRFEIKRVLAEVAGKPEEHAVNYAVLRSMAKAIYSPATEGHYALNSGNYTHFTSPIRRYPDLTIHRALQILLQGKRPPADEDALVLLGEHCSEREQRAEAAERELIKVKLLNFMSQRIGEHLEGVITGVERFGLFVQGLKWPAEGLIAIQSLQDDRYQYDQRSHSLTGFRRGNSFRLGDLVLVQVAHVDVDARTLDYRLVKRLPAAKGPDRKAQKPKKNRKAEGKKGKAKGKGKRRKK